MNQFGEKHWSTIALFETRTIWFPFSNNYCFLRFYAICRIVSFLKDFRNISPRQNYPYKKLLPARSTSHWLAFQFLRKFLFLLVFFRIFTILCFFLNFGIFKVDFNNNLMSGSSDDGWEHSSGCIVSCETSLAHTGSIVYHEGGYFFIVTHFGGGWTWLDWSLNRKQKRHQVLLD